MYPIDKDTLMQEAFSISRFSRLFENNEIPLTGRLREFFQLFQVPEVRQSIFAKIIECKVIFKDEIEAYFKDTGDPGQKNG